MFVVERDFLQNIGSLFGQSVRMMLQAIGHNHAGNLKSDIVAQHLIQSRLIETNRRSFAFDYDEWMAPNTMANNVGSFLHPVEFQCQFNSNSTSSLFQMVMKKGYPVLAHPFFGFHFHPLFSAQALNFPSPFLLANH